MTLTQRVPIEIQFAQGLAGNEQKNRDKTLTLLKKFIRLRLPRLKEPLKEDEFIKLWKGMHYQLWMQDKPLIQEKLVDDICQLVHDFHNEKDTLIFIKTFFDTEAREWFGLDQWRMNKFMMLIREFLYNSFVFLKNRRWKDGVCQELSNILEKSVFSSANSFLPIGLQLHLIDIFPTELQKVADEKLSSDTAVILLSPFLNILPTVKNGVVMKKILSLLFEASGGKEIPKAENAREHTYRPCGFAERDPTKIKETRLQFNKELLLKHLVDKGSDKKCSAKNRNLIYNLVTRIRYLETHPQKPIIMIKDKDVDERDDDVSDEEIIVAAKKLRQEKDKLLEKVPTRKDYKRQLVIEKKAKKASANIDINEADTEEEMDEDGEDDVDSLDYDPEEEFLRLAGSDDDSCEEEMDEDAEEFNDDDDDDDDDEDAEELNNDNDDDDDDASLPIIEHVEEELAKNKEQENLAGTKKNKKSQKAGSKRKNEESLEENVMLQVPEKKSKKEKTKKKKMDAAADKMEVEMPKERKKPKKKAKKNSVSSGVSATEPMFGMVDFPEEEEEGEEKATNESLSEVVVDMQKSSEENAKLKKKKNKRKAKKVKQTKKNKKLQVTKEAEETDDESDTPADVVHFPLPTNAKDSVDISNIQTQNTLHLFEHLKKLKEKESISKIRNKSKNKKKVKASQLDRYFNQIKKEVNSIEKKQKVNIAKENTPVNEEKTSPVSEEKVTATVKEAEAPVEENKNKKGKKNKKVAESKPDPIIKPAALVETKPEKAELETDISERLEELHKRPPAFLRNAIAKVGKSKKVKAKSKKSEPEESVPVKKSTPQGSKRVSFDMNQNISFEDGSEVNQHAFQPNKKPENGILKPSISPIRISKKFSMDKKLSLLAKQSYVASFF